MVLGQSNTAVAEQPNEQQTGTKPNLTIRHKGNRNSYEAAIWAKTSEHNGKQSTSYSVKFSRSFFHTQENKWKNVQSFRTEDLPALALLANEVYRKIQEDENR